MSQETSAAANTASPALEAEGLSVRYGRTTVIEGIHTDERMCAIGELIRGARRQVLQPFLPRADLPDGLCRTRPRTSHTRLLEVARLLEGTARQIVVRG